MKRKLLPQKSNLLLAAVTVIVAAFTAFGQENQPWSQNVSPLPAPTGFVNDYAAVIDAATKQQLETKLKDLKDTTSPSVEIAVAVVKTTGDRDIFDYSLAVARGWKIGSKEDDNPSALLFIAIDDRKYFTQVSRDLEDELPDGLVGSLQRQYLVPEFKKGNYAKGIADTIDAYINAIRNKGNVPVNKNTATQPSTGTTRSGGGGFFGLFCCGVIGLIILLVLFTRSKGGPSKGDRDRWGGGGPGDGLSAALPWIVGSIISSGLSSGSSSSSSGSDWGGSSGGGFGGFGGGGDFGGGGAGGDW